MATTGTVKKMSGLRQYRFQKTSSDSVGSSNLVNIPGRKRIQAMIDSDSEIEMSPKKQTLTVVEKEARLIKIKNMRPEFESMDIQDALFRNDWNIEKAISSLKKLPPSKRSRVDAKEKHNNHSKKTKSSRHGNSDADSDSDIANPTENVFDSDEDEDIEVNSRMNKIRTKVLDFMNKSEEKELLCIKTCLNRKAEAIQSLRPFKNWLDLVTKIQTNKILNTDLLNHCQALLIRRENLVTLMKKCNKIVQRLESTTAEGCTMTKQPKILSPDLVLAQYQLIGLNWLAILHKEDTNGILADEMGLGKTIQVISFLAYLKENNLAENTHLVIVPSSTLDNWDQELAKWCPSLRVEKYYGSLDERRSLRFQWAKSRFEGIDIILTTYRCAMSSPEEKKMFKVTPFHYVIFDEAHMLKNMATQRYEYLVKINAKRRILLTGTPLQNNLMELMSLLCFVMPSIFASKSEDIKNLFKNKPKMENEDDSNVFEQSQIEQAKRVMKPFVLRRLKKDVLTFLPKKTRETIKVSMTSSQKEKYEELVESFNNQTGGMKVTNDVNVLAMMMDMRKLANHPLLLRYHYSDHDVKGMAKILARLPNYKGVNPDYIFEDLALYSDYKLYIMQDKYPELKRYTLPQNLLLDAGKFLELDKMLPKLKNDGHRVLIFSQFVIMLNLLEEYLKIRDHKYMRLDGQTDVMERQSMINEFNRDTDYFIFLLSTRAGGLGINLTSADTVIIYDIDFNPYNDKQAEDRCHRIGQKKEVKIYKFISEGTIEEAMSTVAQEKLNLEKEVTTSEESKTDEVQEHQSMIRLLSMSLGVKTEQAEILLSPVQTKKKSICGDKDRF